MDVIISKNDFFENKKTLDGYVFWKEQINGNFRIRQVCPDKEVKNLLLNLSIEDSLIN